MKRPATIRADRERANPLVAGLLSLSGATALSVLVYHRVLSHHDPMRPSEPTSAEFEHRMRWLKANFNVVRLSEGIAGLRGAPLPPRAVAITFDDGYRDNYDLALPILARLGLPATFFVATGYLDGGCMFNDTVIESVRTIAQPLLDLTDAGLGTYSLQTDADRRAAAVKLLARMKYLPLPEREAVSERIAERAGGRLPTDLMMSSAQVAALHSAGMDIGAHTISHPVLSRVDPLRAREEIVESRNRLESMTCSRVELFAYPNGRPGTDYDGQHVAMVREAGYSGAVSTAWGVARCGADAMQIPRFTPWDRPNWKFGLRLARMRLERARVDKAQPRMSMA